MKKYLYIISIAFFAVMLASCATTKQYPGPIQPSSNIARLDLNIIHYVFINKIDGKGRGLGPMSFIELEPGKHTLVAQCVKQQYFTLNDVANPVLLTFTVEAGNHYQLLGKQISRFYWEVWIANIETGEVISTMVVR